ncbi:Triose-phosphate Transporter family [Rhizoctonia solani]|uniref:Triose-phosphate Transporter family n=2 Tax=Rhizoctonia solani TaxID=456999 RepID=A0A8H8T2H3_9AGAM|nr:Triose-phosphate Transporter family [Rhizoctonia solani]QRW26879.1 Triose-phosphate Transporter family [Rhizoctonia solani]
MSYSALPDDRDHVKSFDSDRPDIDFETDNETQQSREQRKREWWRNAFINSLFIATWFGFATVLSIYNKWMFSGDKFGFPSPLFVTSMHMLMQFLLAALCRFIFPSTFGSPYSPTGKQYAVKAVPCAVTTSLDIGFSNLSLKTITLSFYTMCKSSSLVFVLFFAFLFKLETFSKRLVSVILLITGGVVLMVATETQFAFGGMILVFIASACGGLRWALTQILLHGPKREDDEDDEKDPPMGMDNPCATIFWLAPTMFISLLILTAMVDNLGDVFGSKFFSSPSETIKTALFIMAPGAVAFCMTLAEFYRYIQRSNNHIALCDCIWGSAERMNIIGVGVTILGIALFTYHKYKKSVDHTGSTKSIRLSRRDETAEQVIFETEPPSPLNPGPGPHRTSAPPASSSLRSPRPPLIGKKSVRFERASQENLLQIGDEEEDEGNEVRVLRDRQAERAELLGR